MQSKNLSQHMAANPLHSVWVSASAGTGKTKVLTDRVLRLLISGVDFEKILCLTFTNAAASEMTSRIIKTLLDWNSNPENIELVLGEKPTKSQLKKAKSLFSDLMLSPEQLSIHTIHSFCQRILQKFPFEAGVEAGFRVLSDIETKELCEKLIEELAEELGENDGSCSASWNYILSNTHESTFNDIILEILTNQIGFRDLFHQFSSGLEYGNYLRSKTNTPYEDSFYIKEFASGNHQVLSIVGKELTNNEIDLIERYNNYARLSLASKIKEFEKLKPLFCTAKSEPRKTLLYKKSRTNYPDLEDLLRNIQMGIVDCDQKVKTARMILSTCHMFEIAKYVIEKYTHYKKRLVCLDYDDLVYYTKELLTNNDVKDWVLYKLDGGVMHLLVDEAQDTSPKQWQIIEAIMSEFYSGESASKEDRTIFIVGDEKQSIYSFQGADVSNFARVNHFIKDQMLKSQKQYKDIELDLAYRSTLPILQLVAEIFGGKYFPQSKLQCFRKDDPGLVELWPLYKDTTSPKDLFWPFVDEFETTQGANSLLANDIAKFIKNYIDSGTILPSTGQPARPQDFMILIRRRNQFTHKIISALKEHDVMVAGIDRMMIMQHLSVQDIVSIAKFVLLPEDDLNLAELLKSPIIGLNEEILYDIATKRSGSLYSSLKDQAIIDLLQKFQEMGLNLGAFDFLHKIIDIMGFRENLRAANGEGSDDVLDELLSLAAQWGNKNNDNLQEFIYWLEKREIEIKRDVTSSSSVRVMTVHASKGLESPIVMLPDTSSMPTRQGNFLWRNGDFLWLGSSKNTNMIYASYKSEIDSKDYEEYLRLLYVAVTRAEDHLVVAGFQTQENENEDCWYSLIAASMGKLEHKKEGLSCIPPNPSSSGPYPSSSGPYPSSSGPYPSSSGPYPSSSGPYPSSSGLTRGPTTKYITESSKVMTKKKWVLGSSPRMTTEESSRMTTEESPRMTTEESSRMTTEESSRMTTEESPRMTTEESSEMKSKANDDAVAASPTDYSHVKSPLASRMDISYGSILHKILEDSVKTRNFTFEPSHPYIDALPTRLKEPAIAKLSRLFLMEEFLNITRYPILKTEVSIGDTEDERLKIGRIDLVAISPIEVIIIDYKTDKHPPASSENVDPRYKSQLKFYSDAMKKIMPGHKIIAKILWLENLEFMEVDI